jgi:hypothetical protein
MVTRSIALVGVLAAALVGCGGNTGLATADGGAAGNAGSSAGAGGGAQTGSAGVGGDAGGTGGDGSGTAGTTGAAGTTGIAGITGAAGTTGGAGSTGTAGVTGVAGSAGTVGAAGATGAGGAAGLAGSTGAAGASDSGYTGPFTCTLVAGLLYTSEWFNAGFENDGIDGTTWEGKFQHYGYIDIWAQDPPAGFAWTAPLTSPCMVNSMDPDRALFTAWSWELAYMEDAYIADTVQDIMQFKKHFPHIKRFELMTIVRCPGNTMCNPNAAIPPIAGVTDHNAGQQDCYVAPSQDDALAKVAAMFPGWAYVAPKFEAPACENPLNGAHLDKQNTAIAKAIATYYVSHP